MTIEVRRPNVQVTIDGAPRTILGGNSRDGVEDDFPTATLLLDKAEGKPTVGQTVRIVANGELTFTGEIDVNGIILNPNDIEIQATHVLARLRDTIGTPPTVIDGESEPEYVISWEGVTAGVIFGDVLDAYGVPHGTIADSGKTWGNLRPIGLLAGDSGWDLLKQLDEDEGWLLIGTEDGGVVRVEFSGVPSGAGRTFTQGYDLFAGRVDESRVNTRNRVICTGLPDQTGTTGLNFTPTTILDAPSSWVPSPPTYRAFTHSSPYLETEDDTAAYAARKLGEMNRLRGSMPFELVEGDATLRPGMSIAVDALRLDVRANVRFRITQLVHSYDEGFQTSGTLLLASEGTGWSANQAPIAIIDASAKVETLADASTIVTVSLDGSASYDPELGKDGIVSYIWSGSPVTPTVRPGSAGKTASVVYEDGIPDGASITLTVTDDLGKTGSSTIYPGANGVPLKQRDLISAELTRLQTTRDGGATWVDVLVSGSPIAAVGTCEFAASLYTFAWDGAGNLYKVLADDTATLVLSGAGITACGITLTNGDPETPTGRVWAAGTGGATHRSRADGETGTWEPRAALPNGATATYILESPFAEGDVEAAGGNVYYRSFDNGGAWVAQYTHPHTSLVARRVASGFGKGWAGYGDGGGDDLGASRLVERDDSVTLDWLEADKPISVAGLAVDPFEDTIYALDTDDGGLGRAWVGDSAIGGNMAAAGDWDTVAWGVPRHMIRDGTAPGYLYIAATDKLLKSVDGLATILELKNLSGGAAGRMLGYGAERLAAVLLRDFLASTPGAEKTRWLWNGTANDDPPPAWYAVEYDDAAWLPSVASGSGGSPAVPVDAEPVWADRDGGSRANGEAAVFRRVFTLPNGAVTSATLTVNVDNIPLAVYLNGVYLGGRTDYLITADLVYDVASLLAPGRVNVIAIHGADHPIGGNVWAEPDDRRDHDQRDRQPTNPHLGRG
jgi:hypothetical protein